MGLVRLAFLIISPLVIAFYLQAMFRDLSTPRRQFDESLPPDTRVRVCEKCPAKLADRLPAKPERTHHCSRCRSCVRRMDHHCGFLSGCVGLRNHREFFGLLLTGTVGLSLSLGLAVFAAVEVFQAHLGAETDWKKAAFILAAANGCFIVLGIWAACGSLLCYHTKLVIRGLTTLEDLRSDELPFGFNTLANVRDFFGGYWRAFLPLGPRWDRSHRKYEGFLFEKRGRDLEDSALVFESREATGSVLAETRDLRIEDVRRLLPGEPDATDDENTIYVFNAHQFT